MNSVTTERYRKAFAQLPEHIQEQARKAYRLWKKNPHHLSLQFKCVHKTEQVYSVRISLSFRAIGVKEKDTMIWFWIGSHNDYDKMLSSL
jgi:hypothetical protein